MLVTVYITTKNRRELLARAIDSVINQTYQQIELIVVDDASTDDTPSYLLDLQQQGKLRCILQKESQGACVARNAAIRLAKGEFVTGMDDDDWFTEERIESFVSFWTASSKEYSKVAGLYSNSVELYKNKRLTKQRQSSTDYLELRKSNGIGNQIFAPIEHFKAVEGFDPLMPAWQDWDCWLRMAEKHGVFLNCGAFTYMQDASHDSNRISLKPAEKLRSAKFRLMTKMGKLALTEKLFLNKALVDYRHIVPKFSEIVMVLCLADMRLFVSCIKRKMGSLK